MSVNLYSSRTVKRAAANDVRRVLRWKEKIFRRVVVTMYQINPTTAQPRMLLEEKRPNSRDGLIIVVMRMLKRETGGSGDGCGSRGTMVEICWRDTKFDRKVKKMMKNTK